MNNRVEFNVNGYPRYMACDGAILTLPTGRKKLIGRDSIIQVIDFDKRGYKLLIPIIFLLFIIRICKLLVPLEQGSSKSGGKVTTASTATASFLRSGSSWRRRGLGSRRGRRRGVTALLEHVYTSTLYGGQEGISARLRRG